ncbi:H-NS histone family protein [Lysobacter sp. GX 14042]|uniref:H-NS histone family protein n=1 Tax=Lysobacter sp. GX 14042 TaxID=2907155 RepID=UPI001F46CCB0|nr:H-NS histone family protein [Lysobacter sp. GX 14042]MCE7031643.1 H-NS histone family protein [Lysobacter sp. GX 14042]
MKIEIDKLSLRELDALLTAAKRRQTLLRARRPAAIVRRDLIEFAASNGYAIKELIDPETSSGATRRRKSRSRAQTAAKYRDPENKRHTWSGRGRMPRWLADKVKRGHSVTDFLIPGLARPTAKSGRRIGQRSVVKRH